jgi:hypothetical protein
MTHTFPNAKAMNDAHEDFRLELKELRDRSEAAGAGSSGTYFGSRVISNGIITCAASC